MCGIAIEGLDSITHFISNYICGKIARGIGIIIKARKLLDRETLITLYYSFIYPYLQYCNHVWGNTFITYVRRLFILQKRIIRIIAGVKPREHSAPLFKSMKIFTIFQINEYVIGKFMYQIYNQKTLDTFLLMFQVNSNVHGYSTRQSNHFHLPLPKNELRKSSLCYRGALIWNRILSSEVRTHFSEDLFCLDYKRLLLDANFDAR